MVLARVLLFLRSVVGGCPAGKTGFLVVAYKLNPIHVQYVGPPEAVNVYLIRLKETLDILLFKYGGQPAPIRPIATSNKGRTALYSYHTTLVTKVVESVVGLALQQGTYTWFVEAPFLRTFREFGCALWRLAQCAFAKAGILDKNPFVNHCHSVLAQLPLILIEGCIEEHCLYVLSATAQALCSREQAAIWAAELPYAYCILSLSDHACPCKQ